MSARIATALAHPNIALAKYWGKRPGPGNFPAVPSLSVTLAGLATRTTVVFDDALENDALVLNGEVAEGEASARAVQLLDRVRAASGRKSKARVTSANDFPTASGLASSASGFGALALAATTAAGMDADAAWVSDLARRSSASAARSLFGGFVELAAGPVHPRGDEVLAAVPLAPPSHFDIVVLVCVTTEGAKATASTDGMKITAAESPYYAAWLAEAPRLCAHLKEALLAGDLERTFALAERSALAMHASALAAGVSYFRGATLEALREVHALRAKGHVAYATMDAGPHVKVLVPRSEADAVAKAMAEVPGVLRILRAVPGEGARVEP